MKLILRLVKGILLGFTFSIVSTVIVSSFALKLNKFFIDIFPFVFSSISSFLCARYFVRDMKRGRIFWGIVSSVVMSLIFILISSIVWKGPPTKNSLIRFITMVMSGIFGSFKSQRGMKTVKRVKFQVKKQKSVG